MEETDLKINCIRSVCNSLDFIYTNKKTLKWLLLIIKDTDMTKNMYILFDIVGSCN